MTNDGTLKIKGHHDTGAETVDRFTYLGVVIRDESSIREVLSRAAQTTAARARVKIIF